MAICEKNHRKLFDFTTLQESQDNQHGARHICAGCAYVEGLKDGLDSKPKQNDLSHLQSSQAAAVRHKDAMEAYLAGYAEGQKRSS